jgi:septal ring factor EnvC (AmiA/AmiB activator)
LCGFLHFFSSQLEKLPAVKDRITSVVSEREEARKRSSQLERQLQESVSSMQRELDQYRALVADVERYERQIKERAEMKAELTAKQARIEAMRAQRAKLNSELQSDQEHVGRNEKIEVDIKANLEFRERQKTVKMHQKKVNIVVTQSKNQSY